MSDQFLDRVYESSPDPAEQEALYDQWALTYDAELRANGYRTPGRLARLLAEVLAGDGVDGAPVLDFGCGTGMSGEAMAAEGITVVDGTDLSAEMLGVARSKGVYRELWQLTAGELDVESGSYRAIVACGVISPGAAPAATLDLLVHRLDVGGLLAFSYNAHALADASYTDKLAWLLDQGFTQVASEHGPHIAARNLDSTIYVLRRDERS